MMPKKNKTDNSLSRTKRSIERSTDFAPIITIPKRPPSADPLKLTPKTQTSSGFILQNNKIVSRTSMRPMSATQQKFQPK